MTFRIRTEARATAPDRDPAIWILESDRERAEVWPAQGFNCFRWSVAGVEVLWADPQFLAGSPPTRSGIPILFPFPNRIRAGRFSWAGKAYALPLNDPATKNAIHGFACRRPWRVIDHGADDSGAWITGEFHGARDAPDCATLWPAHYRIRVTCRLEPGRLRLTASVDNPATTPLPFGLGYHHYFAVDSSGACEISVPAARYWELDECLPTGRVLPLPPERDLKRPRRFASLTVDDVLTELPATANAAGLCQRGVLRRGALVMTMWASPDFREAVVFTPPHRQAVCLEPYTCTTDAINLQARGIDAGWRTLEAGEAWTGVVVVSTEY